MTICIAPNCTEEVRAKEMCNKHYKRMSSYGSFDLPIKEIKVCSKSDCDKVVRCKGLCSKHYTDWYESERRVVSEERKNKQKEYYDRLASRSWEDIVVPEEKRCPNCGVVKSSSDYYRSVRSKTGLMSRCKSCEDKRVEEYWNSNGGRRHVSLNYLARKKNATGYLPINAKDILAEFYGGSCAKCGSVDNLQVDHVVSLHNGGENSLANAQLLCKSDNTSKGKRNADHRDFSRGLLVDFIDGKFIVEVDINGHAAS